ncbi:hypothetical protein Bca101_074726 [Brassica carinata]
MDKISAIKTEAAAPAVNKQKNNSIEKERSDTKEIIKVLADRLQKMEEKMDLLISLINSNNEASVSVKTRSVKAERERAMRNLNDSRFFSARGGRGRGRR